MAWFYIILGVFLLLFIKLQEKTIVTPATIIVVCWCFFPAIACFYPFRLYHFSLEVHVCIFLSLFSFLFVYFANTKGTIAKDNEPIIGEANHKILMILNAFVAIWLFRFVKEAWSNILFNSWVNQRTAYADYFDTSTMVLYDVFAKPLIMASCAILAVELFSGKRNINKGLIIIVFINLAQESIVYAARASMVKVVFYLLFAFLFIGRKRSFSFKQRLLPLLVFALLVGGISYVTEGRNVNSGDGILKTIFIYYMAPFAVLNSYLEHPDFSLLDGDHLLYGKAMFGFFYNFIMMVGYVLFGWQYKGNGTDNVIVEVTQHNVVVSPEISLNAAVTADYIFMRDLGYLGIVIGFALFAFVLCKIQHNYYKKHTLRSASIFLFFLYTTMRLSVWHDFLSPSAMMTIVFIFLLTRTQNYSKSNVKTFK